MNEYTRLVRPEQAQVQIEPTAKECPAEGFNYPSFRLLNKQGRVNLSPERLPLDSTRDYRLFVIANSKGWFAAAGLQKDGSSYIILSPLADLRSAFKTAKEGSEEIFPAKRVLPLETNKPLAMTFANNDTRLVVGFEQGQMLVYDTSAILSADAPTPLHVLNSPSSPIIQIRASPSSEPALADWIAVVRRDGTVTLMNTNLEPQGGWQSTDANTTPVAVAWSPKGKHIAIGLQTGDILTYPLTNKESINKHIPPTAEPPLTSLEWLGPGHVFRTVYTPSIPNTSDAAQHVICLDVKINQATYFAPIYPFPIPDREKYQPISLYLPKWDEDVGATETKSLLIVGDKSAVDLEVLGSAGTQWCQQSQENPLSLPLDRNQDDTILVALEADLTDSTTSAPIMYAYLNDGSIQGWALDHSKPYVGIVTSTNASQPVITGSSAGNAAFGQSPFGTTSASASAFGQSTTPSTFATPATPSFGSSAFGQPSTGSAFGKPSAFGSVTTTSAFEGSNTNNTFGGGSAFGSGTGSTTSPFGGNTGGFGAFANKSNAPNAFGQPSFGFAAPSTAAPASSPSPPSAPDMTREESMADGTSDPGFGGLSLGRDTNGDQSNKSGIFGTLNASNSTPSSSESSSAFGGPVKPASGFVAFGSFKPAPTFGSSSSSSASQTPTAFGSVAKPDAPSQPTFGQSTFGPSSFGKSSFGQPAPAFGRGGFGQPSAFGQSAFGKPAPTTTTTTTPSSGGFGAFAAAAPTSFAAAAQQTSGSEGFGATSEKPPTTGGFAAFASPSSSPFGSASTSSPFSASTPTPAAGFGATTSPFAAPSASLRPFGPPRSDTVSPFAPDKSLPGSPFTQPETVMPPKPSGLNTPKDSPPSTPPAELPMLDSDGEAPSPAPAFSSTPTKSNPAGAFSNLQATPSAFKPGSGFGAFGASTTSQSSPFFKTLAKEPTTPSFAALAGMSTSITPTSKPSTGPAFGASSSLGFGTKSAFGTLSPSGAKSAFATSTASTPTPVATPASGGFGAFSGTPSGFGSSTGGGTSFKDLLKTKSDATELPTAKSGISTSTADRVGKKDEKKATPAKQNDEIQEQGSPSRQGTESFPIKGESSTISFENLSLLSGASSFAEISHLSEEEGASENDGTDEHVSDQDYVPGEESDTEESEAEGSSFLSGSEAEYSRDDDEEDGDVSEDPVNIPLPPSRSASRTPQKDLPTFQLTPSPSPSEPSEASILDTIPEEKETTTPPGTPIKQPIPVSAIAKGPPPPFGLTRNTRPTRSSPLASGSVSSLDEAENPETTPTQGQVLKAQPMPSAKFPLKTDADQKHTRPKTPPLLISRSSSKESAQMAAKDSESTTSITPSQLTSLGFFNAKSTPTSTAPATASKLPSLFSHTQAQPAASPSLFTAFTPPPPKQETTTKHFTGFSLQPAIKPESIGSSVSPFAGFSLGNDGNKPPASVPSAPTTPSPGFNLGSFSLKPTERPTSSPGSLFGATQPASQTTPKAPVAIKAEEKTPVAPALAPQPQPKPEAALATMKEGMQRECATIVLALQEELNNIRVLATRHAGVMKETTKSLGGSRHKEDLGDSKKWGLVDAEQFGRVLKQYEKDLDALKEQRAAQKQTLKELQSNMLKAGTRKEEINRFNKAKTDKEFAKMLKARTLGPEHLEAQTQLRRNIRTIRDRIQKLEDHLQTSKKKLAQVKSGKPILRAPTLDTINRTYRNIDIAVQQQMEDVTKLTRRVSKLDIGSPMKGSVVRRDPRLPDPVRIRDSPTPSYAIRSAAALNAERSAARLKRALLAVRKEPLLNTEAVGVAPAPEKGTNREKLAITGASPTPAFKLPPSMPLFSTPNTPQAPVTDPAFDFSPLAEDKFNPSSTPPAIRRGATSGSKKHTPAPVFKSSGQTTSPAAPPTFNWGPLPAFNNVVPEATKAGPAKLPFSFTKPS